MRKEERKWKGREQKKGTEGERVFRSFPRMKKRGKNLSFFRLRSFSENETKKRGRSFSEKKKTSSLSPTQRTVGPKTHLFHRGKPPRPELCRNRGRRRRRRRKDHGTARGGRTAGKRRRRRDGGVFGAGVVGRLDCALAGSTGSAPRSDLQFTPLPPGLRLTHRDCRGFAANGVCLFHGHALGEINHGSPPRPSCHGVYGKLSLDGSKRPLSLCVPSLASHMSPLPLQMVWSPRCPGYGGGHERADVVEEHQDRFPVFSLRMPSQKRIGGDRRGQRPQLARAPTRRPRCTAGNPGFVGRRTVGSSRAGFAGRGRPRPVASRPTRLRVRRPSWPAVVHRSFD